MQMPSPIARNVLDERKVCIRCGHPFRCPLAQIERLKCLACESKDKPWPNGQ